MGITPAFSENQMKPLRSIDPLLFQGAHPETGCFMWFSVLSTPEANGSSGSAEPYYEAQINVSWLFEGPQDEVPATDAERLALMKEMARRGSGFHGVLRHAIESVPDGTRVGEIKLADWPTLKWEGNGLVTLLGDAAHPMTMCTPDYLNMSMKISGRGVLILDF